MLKNRNELVSSRRHLWKAKRSCFVRKKKFAKWLTANGGREAMSEAEEEEKKQSCVFGFLGGSRNEDIFQGRHCSPTAAGSIDLQLGFMPVRAPSRPTLAREEQPESFAACQPWAGITEHDRPNRIEERKQTYAPKSPSHHLNKVTLVV